MKLQDVFRQFEKCKVLIIGDVMIDAYYFGKVERISPEAPVPVLNVSHSEKRLGGAANVALNVQALGAEPILCSVIGKDEYTADFMQLMKGHQLKTSGIVVAPGRRCTVKTRMIGNKHQLLRVDSEQTDTLNKKDQAALLKLIKKLLPACQVLVFEDYDKGVIDPVLIKTVVEWANQAGIPTVVDPKKDNFLQYKNVSLFKPNLKELKEGLKTDADLADMDNLKDALSALQQHLNAGHVMATLSERGVIITDKKQFHHQPAHVRNIADVSGAGDTVISVAALCLAAGLPARRTAALSNLAGGLVCEEIGVVPVNKKRLQQEALRLKI